MIICKGVRKRSRGCENSRGVGKRSRGALYDTAMLLCKGCENDQGGELYDTATIICSGAMAKIWP